MREDGMLVFDVGANVGAKAALMRAKGARVVCIEPQPECVSVLRSKFADDGNVIVVEAALGRRVGRGRLSVCDDADTISTMAEHWKTGRFHDYRWNRSVDVDVVTLDWAINNYGVPDYCKIDVEGFELEVICGLSVCLPLLSFEYSREFSSDVTRIVDHLLSLGFSHFNVSYGETGCFRFAQWVPAEKLVNELLTHPHPLAWGDVYAATSKPTKERLSILPCDSPQQSPRTTLDSLRVAGLSYPGVPLRLRFGGATPDEGFVDITPRPEAPFRIADNLTSIEADLTSLVFPDRSIDEVRVHDAFEHLNRIVALGMLIRWHDALATGGALVIETPDFLATASAALSAAPPTRAALLRHLEGDQAAAWAYHVGQWHPERFERTLSALGYDDVVIETASTEAWHQPPLHNVTARAVKRREVPRTERLARAEELLRESLVSPAEEQTFQVWRRQLHAFLHAESTPPAPIAHAALEPNTASAANADIRALSEFRADHYVRHNQRRQEHLASLGLPLADRSVLELGAGIGDHTSFFLDRGCSVCVTEGRPDLVELLRRRYHWMRVERLDLEDPMPALDERFEIVYAYGLLYHLRDPALAIRTMSHLCTDMLLLETCVAPDDKGGANVVPEDAKLLSQAMSGFGCRPSRPFLLEALRSEFEHVYVSRTQPWHPEFPREWPAPSGSGVLTRAVFVASRRPLALPTLTSELPMRQERH
jgi:FkbM family methyltransferase